MTTNTTLSLGPGLARPEALTAGTGQSAELVHTLHFCRMYHGIMTNAAHAAREAARVHLLATLNLACLLRDLQKQARIARIPVAALYQGNKCKAEEQSRAAELTGGNLLPFTYRTGRNYIKVLEGVEDRMQKGGMPPAECVQVLREHAANLLSGAYDDPNESSSALWTPYLTADSLRQAYLELAPAKPEAPTLSEVLDDTVDAPTPFASWEEQRAKIVSDFGGLWSSLDTFVEEFSRYTTSADREAQASKLEDAARRLRAMKTQPDLPGINPNRQ